MSSAIYPSGVRGLTYTVLKAPEFSTLIQTAPNRYEVRIPQTRNPIWHWSLVYDLLRDYDVQQGYGYTDLRTFMGFFASRLGAFDDFLFDDPDDNYMGPALLTTVWQKTHAYAIDDSVYDGTHWQLAVAGGTSGSSTPSWNHSGGATYDGGVVWVDQGARSGVPNPLAELPIVASGTTNYTPVQRNLGGFYEDVTDLNGAITVYSNGLLMTEGTDFTINGPGFAVPGNSYYGLYLQWLSMPVAPITAEFHFYFRARFEMDQQDFDKFMNLRWAIDGGGRGGGEVKLKSSRPVMEPPVQPACPTCPEWLPLPAPVPGRCRVIIPGTCAGATNGSCGTGVCSGGSASLSMLHESPFATGPGANFTFDLPAWLAAKTKQVYYRVALITISSGAHIAVGAYFWDHSGAGDSTSATGEQIWTNGPNAWPPGNLLADCYIIGTLEDPIGYCYPCGSSSACEMSMQFTPFLVIDYDC